MNRPRHSISVVRAIPFHRQNLVGDRGCVGVGVVVSLDRKPYRATVFGYTRL
jgi:hypothetical protein